MESDGDITHDSWWAFHLPDLSDDGPGIQGRFSSIRKWLSFKVIPFHAGHKSVLRYEPYRSFPGYFCDVSLRYVYSGTAFQQFLHYQILPAPADISVDMDHIYGFSRNKAIKKITLNQLVASFKW